MIDDGYDDGAESSGGFDPVAHVLRVVQSPLGVLRRRWIWMILIAFVGCVATVGWVSTLQPMYLAQARVLISGQQIPEDFVRSTVRENSLEHINAMLGKILSQQNLSGLIDRHELFPEQREKVQRNALIGKLRQNIEITEDQMIKTSRQDQSQIYAMRVEYRDPVKTADIANELASFFVDSSLERRSRQAQVATEFLKRELDRADLELREVNAQIADYRRAHRGDLPGDLGPALGKLERLALRRESLASEIREREDRILILSGAKGAATTSDAEEQLVQLKRDLTTQLAVHTDEHPNVIALRDQITRLEAQLSQQEPNTITPDTSRSLRMKAEEAELKRLREQLVALEAQMVETDARVDRIPGNEDALNALLERAEVLKENYLEFLRKVQDAELAESLEGTQQGPRVTVLDRAQVPNAPTERRLYVLIAGVAISMLLGLGIGLVLELIDPVVLAPDQLEELSGEPCLGSLPAL